MRKNASTSICRGVACVARISRVARRLCHIGRGTPRPYITALFIIIIIIALGIFCKGEAFDLVPMLRVGTQKEDAPRQGGSGHDAERRSCPFQRRALERVGFFFSRIVECLAPTPAFAFEIAFDNAHTGQRRDGSKLWDIYFELTEMSADDTVNIFVWAITQSGETLTCVTFVPDLFGICDTGIVIGGGVKHIIWNIGTDEPNREFYSDSIIIYLAAAMPGWAPGVCGERIYIADTENSRIVRIDDMTGTNWTDYGTYGSSVDEFHTHVGIAIGSDGKIYIADYHNSRIVRIDDMTGTNWIDYGTHGSSVGEFNYPSGIAVGPDGRIYITDHYNHRIVRIDDMFGTNWIDYGTHGSSVGEFNNPFGIAITPDGKIYIADRYNHRIVRIDDMFGTNWIDYGTHGSSVGEFDNPVSITVGPDGRIYITDHYNRRIVRIDDMFGTNWIDYGTHGSSVGEFDNPWGIFVAP